MTKAAPWWAYRDPCEIAARNETRALNSAPGPAAPNHVPRDRYYTQARRLRVKQLMKGRA